MDTTELKGGQHMENTQKSDTITISKNSLWKYSTFALLGIIVLGAIFFVLPGKSPTGNVVNQPGNNLPTEPAEAITLDTDGDPVKGDRNAEITIVEFTDYECPFCARHFTQTGPTIDQYINDGTVKLITKDYPLPFHQQAQKAAEAAHCARDQGGDEAYFAMHDLLFSSGVAGGIAAFEEYAQQMSLNVAEFSACLESDQFADEVQADLTYGSTIGVQGTPAFFINGRMISGACPASVFAQAIEAEKSGDDWGVSNCQLFTA